ncbi:hypothetical protein [Desulfotomaculum copahuensis]|uniref:Uncharacterized protein n=1 Tax=Desulfotomaculum copahuensis TaxID=1838280 RepID=A0A1B7LIQ1_9FIRM|nr:hypothetical protein [Desulfotomaculum copahuensis]OAT86351.1 hypothetical protein A6M21_16725 [Desulfotomaculum copahuensis]
MGTYTAQILIGTEHQNHGGIIPSFVLYLSENSKPAWILLPHGINAGGCPKYQKIVWIPTVKNMLEDALLMISINILRDKEIVEMANRIFGEACSDVNNTLYLYNYENLSQLYKKSRDLESNYKLVITALDNSTILNQLNILEKYKFYVEVCVPVYIRSYSAWSKKITIKGNLDGFIV